MHAAPAGAQDDPLGNWFNDPFVAVRSALADCPMPLGPLMRKSEIRTEEHSRVERGTSCWLAGQCEKPNAYFYDAGIAEELTSRFKATTAFANTTLWITVKRRFVWIEGCTGDQADGGALEAFAKSVPHVELVLVNLRSGPNARIPYSRLEEAPHPP